MQILTRHAWLGLWGLLMWGAFHGISATQAQAPRGKSSGAARQSASAPALEPGDLDLKRSRVYIFVGKTGLGHEHGVEGKLKSGHLQVETRRDAGELEFDMTSFVADTAAARKYVGLEGTTSESTRQQVNKNMLGKDVLNVAKYPLATFMIDSALSKKNKQGETLVELKGEFTLHGTTRVLTLNAKPTYKNGMQNLRGDFTILQTDYGITPYSAALGTVGVTNQLKIYGDLWIAAESSAQK
jgi:polyisoprenoid-binding protein YceI